MDNIELSTNIDIVTDTRINLLLDQYDRPHITKQELASLFLRQGPF